MEECVMKNIEGKFVTVMKTREGPRLCVLDRQNEGNKAPVVRIYTREKNEKNQMALCFLFDNTKYVPKVDGKELQLDEHMGDISLLDSHWFEKNDQGADGHYCLRSVADPSQYLCRKVRFISLSEDRDKCVLVTHTVIE